MVRHWGCICNKERVISLLFLFSLFSLFFYDFFVLFFRLFDV